MSKKSYVTGFPRIGEQRELKKALEAYWAGKSPFSVVEETARTLRQRHWKYQTSAGIGYISSNDFSLYDAMLDTAVMLGAVPERFRGLQDEALYFAMARGNAESVAMEMTKWFNTNYHYIVPELSKDDSYRLNASKLLSEYNEAKALGITTKINLIGPITFLGLSRRIDGDDPFELHAKLLPLYEELLQVISELDDKVTVQIDEPIFVRDNPSRVLSLIKPTYDRLCGVSEHVEIIVNTYFEHACEAVDVLVNTPVWGIGLDFVYGPNNMQALQPIANSGKKLVAGVIDGRNIWKNDMQKTQKLLETIGETLMRESIIVSTSCSLLHTPFTLAYERNMDPEIKNWLSCAVEKLDELALVTKRFFEGDAGLDAHERAMLQVNIDANESRRSSARIHDTNVQKRVEQLNEAGRSEPYEVRIARQKAVLNYLPLATTTIG
ncbi:MAG TPA: 5-methyltetrahydropteroyltriglutamate--homocysteine S-methyltransferase, partial [Sulfuricurvum sp.]|nr:5-methyltetrahydropteroyltriglutamate--homocysteine S-methyltransferase [Sulfuricurvum sp.]